MTDEVTIIREKSKTIDLFDPDVTPSYPEGLNPYPKNYTVKVPADKWNPVVPDAVTEKEE